MEYKYHPIYKYLFFFVITYAFLRHQQVMPLDKLLINTIIVSIFAMIVDHMFVHNHLSIFQPLSDQYFDDNPEIKIVEKELEKEIKEDKMIEKMKKKKNKKNKKKNAEQDRERTFEDHNAEKYNREQEDPYNPENEYERRPSRLPKFREDEFKHYTFYEPSLEQAGMFEPTENYNRYTPSQQSNNRFIEDNFDNILAYNA